MSVRVIVLLVVGALPAAGICIGQANSQEFWELDSQQLFQQLKAQDQRIRELESRLDTTGRPLRIHPAVLKSNDAVLNRLDALEIAYSNDANHSPFDDKGKDTHGEKWSHKWGGRIMGDYVNWASQSPALGGQDYFEFRRMRMFVSGKGYGIYDYKLQLDFEPENTITDSGGDTATFTDGVGMKDAYLGIHDIPRLGYVRFGHFKAPFSLEELTSSKYITFMERSLPNVFSPGREVGVAAFNHSANENVAWGYGVFFDGISEVGKERVDDNQGTRLVTRATWTPYYDDLADGRYLLHTGINFMYTDDRDESVRFRARPEIHEGPRLVDSGTVAATDFTTVGAELAWVNGPLSIQSEFTWVDVDQIAGPELHYYGAYAYASYFLTGEHRPYNRHYGRFERVKPLENFWIINTGEGRCVGRGAWEATVRWSYLDLTDGPSAEQMNDLTVGLNWYTTPYTRMMFNWIHPYTSTPAREEADIIAMRMQVDF